MNNGSSQQQYEAQSLTEPFWCTYTANRILFQPISSDEQRKQQKIWKRVRIFILYRASCVLLLLLLFLRIENKANHCDLRDIMFVCGKLFLKFELVKWHLESCKRYHCIVWLICVLLIFFLFIRIISIVFDCDVVGVFFCTEKLLSSCPPPQSYIGIGFPLFSSFMNKCTYITSNLNWLLLLQNSLMWDDNRRLDGKFAS